MLGLEQLSSDDRKVVARARRLERFLTQPFFATEQFSGIKGKLVSLKDSLDGCERILLDEFESYPESALYMIGAIDEAKKKTTPAKPEAKVEDGAKSAEKVDQKLTDDSMSKPKSEPQPMPQPKLEPKSEPEVKDADDTNES